MPRIHTVAADGTITSSDKLIGSDGAENAKFVTRNYTVGGIKDFILGGTHTGSFTTITTTGNATLGADVSIAGNLAVTGNATIAGNLTFGDADTDTVTIAADVTSNIIPNVDDTYNLGSSTKKWKDIHLAGNVNAANIILTGQTSGIDFADNAKVRFGTGNDLEIYHDSTHSYIKETGDGDLRIETTGSVVVKAPDAAAADLELWADNGDNNSDYWKLTAQIDNVFEIQTKDNGSWAPVIEFGASDKRAYFKGTAGVFIPGVLEVTNNVFIKDQKELRFYDDGSNYVGFKAPALTADKIWTLPAADGSDGQVLKTNGSGTLSWVNNASGGGSGSLTFKQEGDNFTDSLFIGHDTTGTLNQAQKNTAVGIESLKRLTTGDANIAIGYLAAQNVTVGEKNVFIGIEAGGNLRKSHFSVYIGGYAGRYINDSAASGNVDGGNVFVGYNAGMGVSGQTTHLAVSNTGIGAQAMEVVTTGNNNTVVGQEAGKAISTGSQNTLVGSKAGDGITDHQNAIVIGYDAVSAGSNKAVIGNGQISHIVPGVSGNVSLGDDNTGFKELILVSPDNTKFRVKVANDGTLSATSV